MKLLLALLLITTTQAACPLWFAKLITAKRNPQADIVLGRAGDGRILAFAGHKRTETFKVIPEEVVVLDKEHYFARKHGSDAPFRGTYAISRKPVELPADSFILYSNELAAWAQVTGNPRYAAWRMDKKMPFRSLAARLREISILSEADPSFEVINPRIFRHLAEPFFRKTVRAGGRLHVNIHPDDEKFLADLAKLSEPARAAEVSRLKKEYFAGRLDELGSLTRLELLTVASDPELYRAADFYHAYSTRFEAGATFWIGRGKAP